MSPYEQSLAERKINRWKQPSTRVWLTADSFFTYEFAAAQRQLSPRRPATCDLRIIVSCDEAIMLQPLFADYVNFIHYLNEIVVFYKSMVRMIP